MSVTAALRAAAARASNAHVRHRSRLILQQPTPPPPLLTLRFTSFVVVPSVRWVPLTARAGKAGAPTAAPSAGRGAWVASTAAVVGAVTLGEQASAWYGALLNGVFVWWGVWKWGER